jgi:hypothetical protein
VRRVARAAVAFVALELIVLAFDAIGGSHLFLVAAQPLVVLALIAYLD